MIYFLEAVLTANKILYSPNFSATVMPRIAVIDLGTNTFHLLIAAVDQQGYEILHKEKRSVKIGEGGISQGIITREASARALATLAGFKIIMEEQGVQKSFATATSAFRNASNGVELTHQVEQSTGIKIEIIDGEREAELIYQGVQEALEIGPQPALVMDIGGGSVEFIIGTNQNIYWRQSFEIGAQRLLDHYHYHDPIIPQEVVKLESLLDNRLADLAAAMEQYNPRVLIGSSGTFDTLSEIYSQDQELGMATNPERPLTLAGYQKIHQQLISSTRTQRLQIPGMIEMRVDMIVVASCLISYVLDRFNIEEIRVSNYALKEGLLMDAIANIRQNPS